MASGAGPSPVERPPLLYRLLPRRLLSRIVGYLTRIPLGPLLAPFLWLYGKGFGVDRSEMRRPLWRYVSFADFFGRELKEGLRPPDPDPRRLLSVADGAVQRCGEIRDGTLVQVKGLSYSVAELVGDADWAQQFEGGTYQVVYLAPGDYHRYHWPVAGRAHTVQHIPGELWPVNAKAVATVPSLFAVNERVVVRAETRAGAPFAFVPVGALNVGSIHIDGVKLRTNRWRRTAQPVQTVDLPFERGDQAGRFLMGSSIVLLFAESAGRLDELAPGTPLRVGWPIGEVADASPASEA